MSASGLSEEVRGLLLRHIGSVAHLEALLFFRAHPEEGLDAQSAARRLYASETEMLAALKDLTADGFLSLRNGLYRYAPSEEDRTRIEAVAHAYTHQLIAITNLIHNKRGTIRAFSDAFKFRKDR